MGKTRMKIKRKVPKFKFNLNKVDTWDKTSKEKLRGRLETLKESGIKLGSWGDKLLQKLQEETDES